MSTVVGIGLKFGFSFRITLNRVFPRLLSRGRCGVYSPCVIMGK